MTILTNRFHDRITIDDIHHRLNVDLDAISVLESQSYFSHASTIFDVARNEKWRSHCFGLLSPDIITKDRVGTDLVIWREGQGKSEHGTKVGGMPCLTEGRFWPIDENGRKYLFVAQLNLSDSLDVFVSPPLCDLLLVFAKAHPVTGKPQFDKRSIVVIPEVASSAVLQANADLAWLARPTALYGVLYRTFDINVRFPNADRVTGMLGIDPLSFERCFVWEGTKLGGLWCMISAEIETRAVRHLATLCSVLPGTLHPYLDTTRLPPSSQFGPPDFWKVGLPINDAGQIVLTEVQKKGARPVIDFLEESY